jgi:hypothetical protein
MLSRNFVLVCCIILFPLILVSCKDNSVSTGGNVPSLDTSSFAYPFKDGSSWNYSRKYTAFNFRPDSVKRVFSDFPIYGNGTTTILYDTSIYGKMTKCFHVTYTEDSYTYKLREYYGNYDSGLVCFGYRGFFGASLTPYRVGGITFTFKGNIFHSFNELFYTYENNRVTPAAPNDTLILEVPPVVCLKYPEVSGMQWFFKGIEGFDFIYKKYIGFEKVMCGIGYYSCMKTQRIWSTVPELELFDYYSKVGILKRDYTIRDLLIMNEFGDTLGFVDLNDLYTVTSFNITTE